MDTSTIKTVETLSPAGVIGADTAADTQEQDPMLESFGHFRDDPFWEEMMESIRRHRREMDAAWDAPE